jgi:hypothetical protein
MRSAKVPSASLAAARPLQPNLERTSPHLPNSSDPRILNLVPGTCWIDPGSCRHSQKCTSQGTRRPVSSGSHKDKTEWNRGHRTQNGSLGGAIGLAAHPVALRLLPLGLPSIEHIATHTGSVLAERGADVFFLTDSTAGWSPPPGREEPPPQFSVSLFALWQIVGRVSNSLVCFFSVADAQAIPCCTPCWPQ